MKSRVMKLDSKLPEGYKNITKECSFKIDFADIDACIPRLYHKERVIGFMTLHGVYFMCGVEDYIIKTKIRSISPPVETWFSVYKKE
jgi:hypothetical protein